MHIGESLRFIRQSRGLDQKDVAVKANLSPSQLSSIELGQRDPSWRSIKSICAALGVSVTVATMLIEKEDSIVKPLLPLVYQHLWEVSTQKETA